MRTDQPPPLRLSEAPTIAPDALVRDCELGAWTQIGPRCSVVASAIGDYSYAIGDNEIVHASIGKYCSIASHVRVNPGNHPRWRVTQHHLTYRRTQFGLGEDDADFFAWRAAHPVTIGHDVWLGHAAVVMPGVAVGNGAVVGAAAVVTHDVPSYTVVAGVPARPIGRRFDEAAAEAIEASRWWDWTHAQLAERLDDLCDVTTFLRRWST